MLAVDVFVLASGLLHQGAHALRFADNARILGSTRFAALGFFRLDQTLGDQLVAGILKGVEVPNTDTAFEESPTLGAISRKFSDFLESRG